MDVLGGQPLTSADPLTILITLTSLVLTCHTWLLHHYDGRPPRSASEASGPHHDASHVDIIGFNVSTCVEPPPLIISTFV